jgi:hypothetical protein
VSWKNGEDVIIVPAVSDESATQMYPAGWKSTKPYLRIVPQPEQLTISPPRADWTNSATSSIEPATGKRPAGSMLESPQSRSLL